MRTVILFAVVFFSEYLPKGLAAPAQSQKAFDHDRGVSKNTFEQESYRHDSSKPNKMQGPPRAEIEHDYVDGPPSNPEKKFARPHPSSKTEDYEEDHHRRKFSKQSAPVEYEEYQPQRKPFGGGSKKGFGGEVAHHPYKSSRVPEEHEVTNVPNKSTIPKKSRPVQDYDHGPKSNKFTKKTFN